MTRRFASFSIRSLRAVPRMSGIVASAIPLALLAPAAAVAQTGSEVTGNPPRASSTIVTYGAQGMVAEFTGVPGSAARGIGTEVHYRLRIDYVDGEIANPTHGTNGSADQVILRGYLDDGDNPAPVISPAGPFVGPLVEIWPGETLRLSLDNQLFENGGADPSCPAVIAEHNEPHCFNSTNLHFHGGWVSPTGNGDNVLIRIDPGRQFEYEYNIPPDHPAGTFWYHTHLHGSTALQVSSGMAGAIIVRGDRMPRNRDGDIRGGDIDVLLVNGAEPMRERFGLFQQISYACRDDEGEIIAAAADSTTLPPGTWICPDGAVGTVSDYDDQFALNSWRNSGRFTAINGAVQLEFSGVEAGEVQRWRLIGAGVRDSVRMRILPRKDDWATRPQPANAPAGSPALQAYLAEICDFDAPLEVLGLAADGLTRERLDRRVDTYIQPGYREDLLVLFPRAGEYCIVNYEMTANQRVGAPPGPDEPPVGDSSLGRELLGTILVDPGTDLAEGASPADEIIARLRANANTEIFDETIRNHVLGELDGTIAGVEPGTISAFTHHRPISPEDPVDGYRTVAFNIVNRIAGGSFDDTSPGNLSAQFEVGRIGRNFAGQPALIDSSPYESGRIDHLLTLGETEEWELTSFIAAHPFHIHVNPFQIMEVRRLVNGVLGEDLSGPGDPSHNQYANMRGVWKDTVVVEPNVFVKIRSRYERYIGDFVLHCHILDHEDRGMMQNVRIVLPQGPKLPDGTIEAAPAYLHDNH